MKQESIGIVQCGALLFAFLSGSSTIVIPAPLIAYAFNAAWLSLLISLSLGMALLGLMLYLIHRYPGLSFIGICQAAVGKWATVLIVCLMMTAAFHMGTGIIIDVIGFMNSMMLPETPGYIFAGMLIFIAALLIHSGIESIARMFTILTLITFVFWIIIIVLLLPGGEREFLRPIFPEGIRPMLLGSYLTAGFPYGEIVLFTVILPFTRDTKTKKLTKSLFFVLLMNGAMLVITTITTIMVLGPMAVEKKYSLFVLAQTVELGEFLERIEAITGMSMIAGSLMKATIVYYVIQTILTDLFGIKDRRLLTNPLCLLIFIMTLSMPTSMRRWETLVLVTHSLWIGIAYLVPFMVIVTATLCRDMFRTAPA